MPNLNSDLPWSDLADRDLRWCFDQEWPLAMIADFLCRDVEEVVARVRDLGLLRSELIAGSLRGTTAAPTPEPLPVQKAGFRLCGPAPLRPARHPPATR